MKKIEPRLRVNAPNGAYGIFIGEGLLDSVGKIVASRGEKFSRRCAIVTNPTVGARYAARVVDALARKNFVARVIEIPDGEKFKTLETMRAVYDQLIDAQIDRGSIIFALGGGVIGDVAGFCAATILRGVPFIQIPTTLLAMVDSSIGGKVGVDHPRGKNLIGAFYPPRAIIADIATLNT
ncbi:MAG: iron-containing alcohol dehydrogenase, partial [Chloroflexi bacterium]|nr:iron-containing alcohol dehydrogenase [Chloroflexota bacterium]